MNAARYEVRKGLTGGWIVEDLAAEVVSIRRYDTKTAAIAAAASLEAREADIAASIAYGSPVTAEVA